MWKPVVPTAANETQARAAPSARSKHAVCLDPRNNDVYVLGGRNGSIPLKDFWTFSIECGRWSCLSGRCGAPTNLQEHSINYWDGKLYVFGGVFSQANDCPLWIYDTQLGKWSQWKGRSGQQWPQGRRAHTAVVWQQSLLVYGGYQDLRGSLGELWQFTFETSEWKMIHGNEPKKITQVIPSARHRHSAVVFNQGMWVYGGMTDLQERGDLWRLDLISKQWSCIKCKLSPGALHSHSAVRLHAFMLLIGGETQATLTNEVWRFHFATETWERLETGDPKPTARTQLAAVAFNVPLFAAHGGAADVRSKSTPAAAAAAADDDDDDDDDGRPTAMTGSGVKSATHKSRGTSALLGLRNHRGGYRLVDSAPWLNRPGSDGDGDDEPPDDDEDDDGEDPEPAPMRLAAPVNCWIMTKSSTYSLLSNASTDSLLPATGAQDDSPVRDLNDEPAGVERKPRSESVHNFGGHGASRLRSMALLPRSLTSNRVNPFDATGWQLGGAPASRRLHHPPPQRCETLTSDYCSQDSSVSILGIANPLYDAQVGDDDHKRYAMALNRSLAAAASVEGTGSRLSKLLQAAEPLADDYPLQEAETATTAVVDKAIDNWAVLTLGGREASHAAAFDRPLSMWKFCF